ncbi:hypothetical protein [Rhodopseudomonas telluris]|uniref:Transposase n=1 Tax=Rhodopseudomonas telluris TaxID=644215 RepID=A0ABV6EX49_9BRAD
MEGTGIAAISALLPRRHIDLRCRQPEYRRKAHHLQYPATRKQLRIFDSEFQIADSKLQIAVAMLKICVADLDISDS